MVFLFCSKLTLDSLTGQEHILLPCIPELLRISFRQWAHSFFLDLTNHKRLSHFSMIFWLKIQVTFRTNLYRFLFDKHNFYWLIRQCINQTTQFKSSVLFEQKIKTIRTYTYHSNPIVFWWIFKNTRHLIHKESVLILK